MADLRTSEEEDRDEIIEQLTVVDDPSDDLGGRITNQSYPRHTARDLQHRTRDQPQRRESSGPLLVEETIHEAKDQNETTHSTQINETYQAYMTRV